MFAYVSEFVSSADNTPLTYILTLLLGWSNTATTLYQVFAAGTSYEAY